MGKGSEGEDLVVDPFSMGSGQAQLKKEKWVLPDVAPQPTGAAIEVWCYIDQVALKARGLGIPIPSC